MAGVGPVRGWQLVEVVVPDPADTQALTDGELLGLSILAAQYCRSLEGAPFDPLTSVYGRAWRKIQPQVERVLARDGGA